MVGPGYGTLEIVITITIAITITPGLYTL